MLLEFIESNKIILCATPVITEEDQIIRYVKCAFHFTSELWLNMVAIRAVFKSASYGDSEEVILDSSNCCYMPIDVYKHGGVIQVALYGDYLANNGTRAVTSYIGPVNVFFGKNPRLPVPIPSRYDVFVAEYFRILSENSAVLDEMQQLIEDFSDISDIRFTEDLHLVITMRNGDVYVSPVSLKGDKGDKGDRGNPGASGLQGEPGPSGADGKSAYEAAVSGGYSGTEAEFEARLASAIPSKTSDLVNDSGFLTEAPVTSVNGQTGVVTIAVPTKTSDLTNDSGYILVETDPTVPAWAKASTKPTYTASEVGALPSSTVIPSKTSDLTNDSGFLSSAAMIVHLTKVNDAFSSDKTYAEITSAIASGIMVYVEYSTFLYAYDGSSGSDYFFSSKIIEAAQATQNDLTLSTSGGATVWSLTTYTFTDSDQKLAVAAVNSGTQYYPVLSTNRGTSATRQFDTTGLAYKGTNGTTSVVGSAALTLGNSTAAGAANNKQGKLIIYGSTAYAHTIEGVPTAARTLNLPDKDGTFALTSDVPTAVSDLTNDAGYLTLADLPVYNGGVS